MNSRRFSILVSLLAFYDKNFRVSFTLLMFVQVDLFGYFKRLTLIYDKVFEHLLNVFVFGYKDVLFGAKSLKFFAIKIINIKLLNKISPKKN